MEVEVVKYLSNALAIVDVKVILIVGVRISSPLEKTARMVFATR